MMRLSAILMLAMLLLAGCAKTSDEEQIAQAITALSEAVENKKFMAIQPYLHESFRANDQMDARQVKQLLAMYGVQHKRLGVTIAGSKTTLDPVYPDRASTMMSIILTGSSGRLPSDGSVLTVELEWIKVSGDWLVRTAKWQP
jgi:outer membrane murein-binding lipoprotein Lpp